MSKVLDVTGKLHINLKAREWCKLPYPGHPKGCPEYGQRASCPPAAPLIADLFDLDAPLWLVCIRFDLAAHVLKMQSSHPDWSYRQLKCVLYWQGGVNAVLRQETVKLVSQMPDTIYTLYPEAMGINVIATAQDAGLPIETKPVSIVYKISLIGYPK